MLAALSGFSAVALGAFAAHALGETLSSEQSGWWETATLYLLVHAGVGVAIAISAKSDRLSHAGTIMIAGSIIFAATLYAMALGAPRWFGAITPIGGIGMLAGWTIIYFQMLRSR